MSRSRIASKMFASRRAAPAAPSACTAVVQLAACRCARERHQVAQLHQVIHLVHIAAPTAARPPASRSSPSSSISSWRMERRHVALHLETHDLAEAALEDLLLDRLQQILGLVDLPEVEVGVPRDAEGVPSRRSSCRETAPTGSRRSRPRAATKQFGRPVGTQRGSERGTFTRAKCSTPVGGVADLDRQRQRKIRDVRERVPGIDRQRRQHREHLRLEVRVDRAALPPA